MLIVRTDKLWQSQEFFFEVNETVKVQFHLDVSFMGDKSANEKASLQFTLDETQSHFESSIPRIWFMVEYKFQIHTIPI